MVAAYEHITIARAEILRELADGHTEREIADHLTMTVAGVRSRVEELKQITGCSGVRDLGRWWREHRERWMAYMATVAGTPAIYGY